MNPISKPVFGDLLSVSTRCRAVSATFLLVVGLPSLAYSQPDAGPISAKPEAVYRLDPLVVTPTLALQSSAESLSSVTVIDEQTIRRQQPREFAELLQAQPGVDVVSSGSFGKATSVYMRGTGSESVVLLVDGVRMRSATLGTAPWAYLPPQMLERVEIVRGPRGSLYGSDAVGGVVQAFTRSPTENPEGWVSLGGGSFDSREVGAGATGSNGRFRYSLHANHFETDGTRLVEGGDDKGYHNTSGVARVSHQFDNGGEAGLLFLRAEGNSEFVGGETDYAIQTLGLTLATPVSDYWFSRVLFAESLDDEETLDSGFAYAFETKTRSARWENHLYAGAHQFIVGTELLVDRVESTNTYDENSRNNTALFGQALFDLGRADLQLSLRGDDNEAYGRNETGGVTLGVALDESHRVRASYATAFRAPTFNELYYPGFGNPELAAEEAISFELGISAQHERWFWDAVVYQTDVEDLIISVDQGGVFLPQNVAEARIRGAEFTSGLQLDDWTLKAVAAVIDPRNRETDNRVRRRSGKQLRVEVDHRIHELGAGDVTLGATLKSQGYRYEDAANETRLPGFATVDLRIGWEITRHWTTQLTVDNVLDKEYATALRWDGSEFISAGRSAFLSVQYDIH